MVICVSICFAKALWQGVQPSYSPEIEQEIKAIENNLIQFPFLPGINTQLNLLD